MTKVLPGVLLATACSVALDAGAALIDRGNGLIYDDVLNVTWLADANHARTSGHSVDGRMDWDAAMQ